MHSILLAILPLYIQHANALARPWHHSTGGIYRGRGPQQNNQLTHAISEQSKLTHCSSASLENIAKRCLAVCPSAFHRNCNEM